MQRLIVSQFGVITRTQALATGMSAHTIRYRIRSGRWVRIFRDVYRSAEVDSSWRQRLLAAQLSLGEGCVVSHRSAGAIYGLRGVPTDVIELTVVGDRHLKRQGVSVHRTVYLPSKDIKQKGPFVATSVERTVCDLASVVKPKAVASAIDSALGQRLTTVERIWRVMSESRPHGCRGTAVMRTLLEPRLAGMKATDSDLELEFLSFCKESGLPLPENQQRFADDRGNIGRIDFTYPAAKVLIEVDGYQWHVEVDQWRRDRERDRRLQALGWRVLRYTWWDLHEKRKQTAVEIWSFLAPRLAM